MIILKKFFDLFFNMKGKYKIDSQVLKRIVREREIYTYGFPFCKLLRNGKLLIWSDYLSSDVLISEMFYPLDKYRKNIFDQIDNDEIKEILRRKEAEELIDGDINKAINRDIVEVQGKKIKYVRYDYHCQKILCEGILDK